MKPQAVKGTHDILPEEQPRWRHLLGTAARVLGRAGVQEITTPAFEHSDVFIKSVGASADIVVQKEMYTFSDSGGRSLSLRPEFTASVLRAFIEHGMATRPSPVKLWSVGPVFRAEVNTQRGRFRQFHQVNCELLGLEQPLLDAEAIALLYTLLHEAGLKNLVVKLGSVGDPEDRAAYNNYLRETLAARTHELSEVSRTRLALNPMRILDSKERQDQAIIEGLKRPLAFLNPAARTHFEAVQGYLSAWDVPFEVDDSIVRGLDYYRRTAFEVHHSHIGAQSALCGGGRYDGLVENLGGPATPGVGWAFGIERVLDALEQDGLTPPPLEGPLLFLVPMDDTALSEVVTLAFALRRDHRVEHAYTPRNPGKGLREADRAGARYAALRGAREREQGVYTVKHLVSGEQLEVPEETLSEFLAQKPVQKPV